MKIKEVYKLRNEVKIMIISLLVGALLGIIIYQLFTVKSIDKVTGATCKGGIVKICTGTPSQYQMAMDN